MNVAMMPAQKPVTSADLDTRDVHEALAIMNGRDECRCKTCTRVASNGKVKS